MVNESRILYEFGPFRLDPVERILLKQGSLVPLNGRALDTLLLLVQRRGHLVEKDEILREVWAGADVEENNLAQSIGRVRRALEAERSLGPCIETVHGGGYLFTARVRSVRNNRVEERPRNGVRPESYRLYMQGRYYWNRMTESGFHRALGCFEQAAKLDPSCAVAHAGAADTFIRFSDMSFLPARDALESAHRAVRRALDAERRQPEARATAALLRMYVDWHPAAAHDSLEQAIELDPTYATAVQWYGWCKFALGRLCEAREMFRQALDLDPHCPMIRLMLGVCLQLEGHPAEGAAEFQRVIDEDDDFALAHYSLGWAHHELGRATEAERTLRRAAADPGVVYQAGLACYLAQTGRTEEALVLRRKLLDAAKTRFICPYHLATVDASLGRTNTALRYLEQAFEQHSPRLVWMRNDGLLGPLRDQHRFGSIVDRVGFYA
jgi:adenylate cyclase